MDAPRLDHLPRHELGGGHRVLVASTRRSRAAGLGGLEGMPARTALLIPRCRSVHTLTMRFPLDLVWLGADGAVERIDRAVPPRRLRSCLRARSVLECPAGTADEFVRAGLERLGPV